MRVRAPAAPVLALVLVLVSGGCGPEPAAEKAAPKASEAATTDRAGPGHEDPADGHGAGAPDAGPPTPAATAGSLDRRDLPGPERLGQGWTAYRDPGGAEKGFAGNGDWVRARGPAEVVDALVPLGCAGAGTMPRPPQPVHALEATFRGPVGEPAVALALEYADGPAAATAFRRLARLYAACTATRGDGTVIATRRSRPGVVWQERRFGGTATGGDAWREVLVREGGTVALIAAAVAVPDSAPDFPTLERALRSGLRQGARSPGARGPAGTAP